MFQKTLLFAFTFLLAHSVFAQNTEDDNCATIFPEMEWENTFQQLISEFLEQKGNSNTSVSYSIPIVFHVIHGGETIGNFPNIHQDQIYSQISILNQDLSGNSYNAANYPVNAFVNWAISQNINALNLDSLGRLKIADFEIQICPALLDENGNLLSEPGINRINYQSKGWANPTQFGTQATMKSFLDNTVKPQSIWDPRKYLNVWISDKSNALTYAGVSSVPPLSGLSDIPNTSTDSTDGIWCFAKAIGSYQIYPAGHYISPNIDGRTMTHEIGHYLGLRHIWGDAACGNDFCNDTPPASSQNTGAPSYPWRAGSCSSPSNSPDGEMFMNFMDYSMGPSKYMFSPDQKTRAHTAMLNSPQRNQLGSHGLCSSASAIDLEQENKLKIFPNPSSSEFYIEFDEEQKVLLISLYNLNGQEIKTEILENSKFHKIAIGGPSGFYILKVSDENQSVRFYKIIKE